MMIAGWLVPLLTVAALSTSSQTAVRVPVLVETRMIVPASGDAPVAARLRIRCGGGEETIVEMAVPGERMVELPPRACYMAILSDRLWSGEQAFLITPSMKSVRLSTWPAGVIRGQLEPKDAGSSVTLLVHSDGDTQRVIPCHVDDGGWSCVVPAGVHDIRIRAPGFVSHYLWAMRIAEGRTSDLAAVRLRRGSSVVGRVSIDSGSRRIPETTVRLRPQTSPGGMDEAQHRRVTTLTASVNPRGFFHFDGAPAGRYTVVATSPGMAEASVDVVVVEGRESELSEPLLLTRPFTLTVKTTDALDPFGKPWRIVLSRESDRPGRYERFAEDVLDRNGEWRWRGAKANYRVEIGPSSGDVWAYEIVTLDHDRTLEVSLPAAFVSGHLRMGGRALRAKLRFSHPSGRNAVFHSDADGAFSGLLPPAADRKWYVQVENEALTVSREIEVVVSQDDEIEIELPAGRLAGNLLDEAGRPVAEGIVMLMVGGDLVQTVADKAGVYAVEGLPGGRYSVEVNAGELEGGPIAVELPDEADQRLDVVLRASDAVRGTVASRYSGPVGGATVTLLPLQQAIIAPSGTTDVQGAFSVHLPAPIQEFDVAVSAPGFARRVFRARRKKGYSIRMELAQDGGTLTLDVPAAALSDPKADGAYLFHGGGRLPVAFAAHRWGRHSPSSGAKTVRVIVPQMEPGDYALCMIPAGAMFDPNVRPDHQCARGLLAPYGELTLSLTEPPDSAL